MNSCPYCDAPMSNPRRVQCGAPECKRKYQAERVRKYLAEYRAKTGEPYQNRYFKEGSCTVCGEPIRIRPGKSNTTCKRCWHGKFVAEFAEARAERARQRRLPVPFEGEVRRPGRVLAVVRPLRRCWYMGYCACCGQSFIHDQPHTRTCSARCAKRLQRDRRRALERDAFVVDISPRGIFERDRWTCQLCGTRVAWSKQVPHPRAPVIDHIVPLAAGPESGGVHAPWNVQTAHFLCNSIKCAEFDQAALF